MCGSSWYVMLAAVKILVLLSVSHYGHDGMLAICLNVQLHRLSKSPRHVGILCYFFTDFQRVMIVNLYVFDLLFVTWAQTCLVSTVISQLHARLMQSPSI